MYCINCGKEIEGNIPICGECLQGVLDQYKAKQDVLTRVNLEAQPFNIKDNSSETVVEEEAEQTSCTSQDENAVNEESPTTSQQSSKEDSIGDVISVFIVLVIITLSIIAAT